MGSKRSGRSRRPGQYLERVPSTVDPIGIDGMVGLYHWLMAMFHFTATALKHLYTSGESITSKRRQISPHSCLHAPLPCHSRSYCSIYSSSSFSVSSFSLPAPFTLLCVFRNSVLYSIVELIRVHRLEKCVLFIHQKCALIIHQYRVFRM